MSTEQESSTSTPEASQATAGGGEQSVVVEQERVARPRLPARPQRSYLPDSWRVELPVFEGPLDLLLQLIRINEVEITDIPIALVCDQYHEYLELMEELDLDIAGEYIYEAALLIQLKARTLLPPTDSEEGEEEDPREELVSRLLEYQRLKDAAQTLAEVDRVRQGLWTRSSDPVRDFGADDAEQEMDLGDLSLYDLLSTLREVLKRYDEEHPDPLLFRGETFSVRDQIRRLLSRLEAAKPVDLVDDLLTLSCRSEAIAAFLAILEMGRMGLVRLHQAGEKTIYLHRTTRALSDADLEAIEL